MAGSRLDFNTGRIVDPNESAQTHVNAAATIIGNLSKQYLDKQQHEERMAESRAQQADAKDRFAQELAFNREKWNKADTYAQADEARAEAEHKFKMDERAKAENARKAIANFGSYMDTTAAAAFKAEKPKAAQTVANTHIAKIVADLETRAKADEELGPSLVAQSNRDTIKAMQTSDAANQQSKALTANPNDLVIALAKDRATDNPKLKRDAFLHLISQDVPAADAIALLELQGKLAGDLTADQQIAARKNALDERKLQLDAGRAFLNAGEYNAPAGSGKGSGDIPKYNNDIFGIGNTTHNVAKDVRQKLLMAFPDATSSQVESALREGIARNSDVTTGGEYDVTGSPSDVLAVASKVMKTGSTNGQSEAAKVNNALGQELLQRATQGLGASTVGMTQAEKEVNRANEVKSMLDRQFGTPAGDASRYSEYQRSLPTASTTNKPTEAVKVIPQTSVPLAQNTLAMSFAETGKVDPNEAKAYGEQLVGEGVNPEAVKYATERAIKTNNAAELLALNPEYNIKRKDDWLGQLSSWLDRGRIKDEYYTVRNNVLAKALENNATIEQAKAIADANPDVSALAARMANASNIATDADAVRRMQTLPAHNIRGLLKQVAEDKTIKEPDNYRSIMGWAINK